MCRGTWLSQNTLQFVTQRMLLQTAQCGLIQISSKLLVTCLLIGPLILILIKFLVLWRLSNQNWKPPVLRRNRTKPKPQFSGGYVMVFLKFQKWPSLITKVRNDNVITGHAMTPAATVWSNCLTVWSGVALQINYWPQWTHVTLWHQLKWQTRLLRQRVK